MNSPVRDVYEKTLALWSSLMKNGCGAPHYEPTVFFDVDLAKRERLDTQLEMARRGHDAKATCNGCLLLEYNHNEDAYVRYVLLTLQILLNKHLC